MHDLHTIIRRNEEAAEREFVRATKQSKGKQHAHDLELGAAWAEHARYRANERTRVDRDILRSFGLE